MQTRVSLFTRPPGRIGLTLTAALAFDVQMFGHSGFAAGETGKREHDARSARSPRPFRRRRAAVRVPNLAHESRVTTEELTHIVSSARTPRRPDEVPQVHEGRGTRSLRPPPAQTNKARRDETCVVQCARRA